MGASPTTYLYFVYTCRVVTIASLICLYFILMYHSHAAIILTCFMCFIVTLLITLGDLVNRFAYDRNYEDPLKEGKSKRTLLRVIIVFIIVFLSKVKERSRTESIMRKRGWLRRFTAYSTANINVFMSRSSLAATNETASTSIPTQRSATISFS